MVWAHPGPDWRPIAETLAGRGWLDGIELRNGVLQGRAGTRRVAGAWLWPQVMDWCLARDLAIFASSDAHWPIDFMYDRARGERRDMTLLLARSRDLEAVREAIRARRTLACFGGTLWGKEPWLRELVRASLDLRFPPPSGIPSRLRYSLLAANRSSLELRVKLAAPGAAFPEREFRVPPGPATAVPFDLRPEGRALRSLDLTITVVNLFSGLDRPLVLEAKLELPR